MKYKKLQTAIIDDNGIDFEALLNYKRNFDFVNDFEQSSLICQIFRDYLLNKTEEKKNELENELEKLKGIDLLLLDYELLQNGSNTINGLDFYEEFIMNNKSFFRTTVIFITGIGNEIAKTIRGDLATYVIRSKKNIGFSEKNFDDENFENKLIVSIEAVMKKKQKPIVILTAILEEYNAVGSFLKDVEKIIAEDGSIYKKGIFEYNDCISEVIIRECGAKNTYAAQETQRTISLFNPDYVFFVGIAGSRKEEDFGIGDVIFPEKIYSYEGGKDTKDHFLARPDLVASSFELYELAKEERREAGWKNFIKESYKQNDYKANLGVIASGEKIIESKKSNIGKLLNDSYNDTSAVEMEGFGFASAVNRQKQPIKFAVIRGISDILSTDEEGNISIEINKRPKNNKEIASNTAAAFTYWLIYKTLSVN